jgi:hypothetical protein
VSEKRPPIVISWFDDGDVELSQPAARTVRAKTEVVAARRMCEMRNRVEVERFMVCLSDGNVTVLVRKIHADEVCGHDVFATL